MLHRSHQPDQRIRSLMIKDSWNSAEVPNARSGIKIEDSCDFARPAAFKSCRVAGCAENLSIRNEIGLENGASIGIGGMREAYAAGAAHLHTVTIAIEVPRRRAASAAASPHHRRLLRPTTKRRRNCWTKISSNWTLSRLSLSRRNEAAPDRVPEERSATSSSSACKRCFPQCTDAGSAEFYDQLAGALVAMVGLDLGLVLFSTTISSFGAEASTHDARCVSARAFASRGSKQANLLPGLVLLPVNREELARIEAWWYAILGASQDVVGVLYGVRYKDPLARGGIRNRASNRSASRCRRRR